MMKEQIKYKKRGPKQTIVGKQIELIKELNAGESIFLQIPSKSIYVYKKDILKGIDFVTEDCLIIINKNSDEPGTENITRVTRI